MGVEQSARITVRSVGLVGLVTLALAACGGDDDAAPPLGAVTTSVAPVTLPSDTAPSSTEAEATTTTESTTTTPSEPEVDPASLGIDACVLGTWVRDNNSFAEATTALTGVTVSVEGVNVLSLSFSLPDPGSDQVPVLLDEYFNFRTEIEGLGDSAAFTLNASDMGLFSTEFEQPGRGVLTGIEVYSLGDANVVELSAGDATVTVGDRTTLIDIPGYLDVVDSGTGEVSGWEEPRPYECSESELRFVAPGVPTIRYTRDS
jgi:hypothetical protein